MEPEQIQRALRELDEWSVKDGKLHKEFSFTDFSETRAFIEHVCDAADELNHHPEVWFTYAKAIVEIVTHDSDGLTEKDFALARKI